MNYTGKLYTFGCSMTSYTYPTWADILGREFSYYENWGQEGAGNCFIYNSIIECLTRNTISSKDTFIIMWSGIARTDFYKRDKWSASHDISMVNSLNCPIGFEILSYGYIAGIEQLLTSMGINFIMLGWSKYDVDSKPGKLYKSTLDNILHIDYIPTSKKLVKSAAVDIEYLYDKLSGSDWPPYELIFKYNLNDYSSKINKEVQLFLDEIKNNKSLYFSDTVIDLHPTPLEHLNIVKNTFKDIEISTSTVEWIHSVNQELLNGISIKFDKSLPERL